MTLSKWTAIGLVLPAGLLADPAATPPPNLLDSYVSAVQAQQERSKPAALVVDIDAKVPRLRKEGRLHALRFISNLGKITYRILQFEGDNTVKKDVIARYLAAEQEARSQQTTSLAITPANYRFKYKGTSDYAGRTAHVFQLTPKQKRIGLFKGELWIDSETSLPLREWGEMVKNPSVFLKSVYFVRDYHIADGVATPRRLISDVNTRLVGKVNLTIWFDRVATEALGPTELAALAGGGAPTGDQVFPSK